MTTVSVNTEPRNPQIPTEPFGAWVPLSPGASIQHRLRRPGLAIMQEIIQDLVLFHSRLGSLSFARFTGSHNSRSRNRGDYDITETHAKHREGRLGFHCYSPGGLPWGGGI